MKEFRKNEQGLFICEECDKTFIYKKTLSYHINKIHNYKNYYYKWIKDERDLCKICKKETIFINFKIGYKKCCSKECTNRLREQTCLKKYGVTHVSKSIIIKEKSKQTCQEKYGVNNPWQAEKIKQKSKQSCLKKYGVEYSQQNIKIKEKTKKTCKERYGVECSLQNLEIREKGNKTKQQKYNNKNYCNIEKIKQSCLIHYGVENPSQDINILNKGYKTRFLIHQYKNTNLTYQGSYELDFLDNFYDKIDIENGHSIKYKMNEKNKVYHSDFYIPSKNLIVEIKNSYLAKKDKNEIELKKKVVIKEGYDYLIIINKDYNEFINLYLSFSNSITNTC
jgi:uncharacterized C2H2 Zn-finger protein